MCEKCVEVDRDIARFTEMSERTTDPVARDVIAGLLNKLQFKKLKLHPEALDQDAGW